MADSDSTLGDAFWIDDETNPDALSAAIVAGIHLLSITDLTRQERQFIAQSLLRYMASLKTLADARSKLLSQALIQRDEARGELTKIGRKAFWAAKS